ncbi:MAG: hypothetical protein WDN31_13935 [Hyphomicrobium sp.]
MKCDGIDIARRTVAKYREAMRIPLLRAASARQTAHRARDAGDVSSEGTDAKKRRHARAAGPHHRGTAGPRPEGLCAASDCSIRTGARRRAAVAKLTLAILQTHDRGMAPFLQFDAWEYSPSEHKLENFSTKQHWHGHRGAKKPLEPKP